MELKRVLLIIFVVFILLQLFLFQDVITGRNVRMRSYSQIQMDFSQDLSPEITTETPDGRVKRTYRIDAVWILPFVTRQMEENSRVMVEVYSRGPVSSRNGSWAMLKINEEPIFSRNLTWNGTHFIWAHSDPLGIQIPLKNFSRSPPVIEIETSEGVEWELERIYVLITFFPQDIKIPYWQENRLVWASIWALFVVEVIIGIWCARSFVRWIREQ